MASGLMQEDAKTPYEKLGGAGGVQRLVERFYHLMEHQPQFSAVRALHGPDLSKPRQALFEFLSGWLGGPPLYSQRTGSICITHAHQPFAIGPAERDQWVMCMRQALSDVGIPADTREMLDQPIYMIADFVRNRD